MYISTVCLVNSHTKRVEWAASKCWYTSDDFPNPESSELEISHSLESAVDPERQSGAVELCGPCFVRV